MRPGVDIVVPFRGEPKELDDLRERLARLRLGPEDSVLVVNNTPAGRSLPGRVPVLHAAEVATPAYARNQGAELGTAQWIAFLDADTAAPAELLDLYFDPPPGDQTGLLAGGIVDEPIPPDGPPAARYGYLRRSMSQENTFSFGTWAFGQTANAACRRVAFEAVGGFRENIRAAEDADLTYRLRAAGWQVERRDHAAVVHANRQTVRSFVGQKALHGAGGGWLAANYPGSFPGHRRPGLLWWGARHLVTGLIGAARARDRDGALWAVFEPLEIISRELGRSLSNDRPRLR